MSLSCPGCGNRLSRWEAVKFIRLMTIYCTKCDSPLSLDKPGRTALWLPIILALLLIVICMKACDLKYIPLILLIAGFVAGALCADRCGTLSTPSGEEPQS
jgi:hypothetical protein